MHDSAHEESEREVRDLDDRSIIAEVERTKQTLYGS